MAPENFISPEWGQFGSSVSLLREASAESSVYWTILWDEVMKFYSSAVIRMAMEKLMQTSVMFCKLKVSSSGSIDERKTMQRMTAPRVTRRTEASKWRPK